MAAPLGIIRVHVQLIPSLHTLSVAYDGAGSGSTPMSDGLGGLKFSEEARLRTATNIGHTSASVSASSLARRLGIATDCSLKYHP